MPPNAILRTIKKGFSLYDHHGAPIIYHLKVVLWRGAPDCSSSSSGGAHGWQRFLARSARLYVRPSVPSTLFWAEASTVVVGAYPIRRLRALGTLVPHSCSVEVRWSEVMHISDRYRVSWLRRLCNNISVDRLVQAAATCSETITVIFPDKSVQNYA